MESLNKQLKELYSKNWDILIEELDSDKAPMASSYPLLIKINEAKYMMSDIKWMVFGKETNGWGEYDGTIDSLLNNYYRFTDSSGDFDVDYSGYFWPGVKKFHKMLNSKFKKKTYLIYNNLLKIGKLDKGRPPKYITDIERNHFSVIRDEIRILKPDILLFLSGYNYDDVIKDIWGDISYKAVTPYEKDDLAIVNVPDVKIAFRTAHPRTLSLWGKEEYDKAFNTIISMIRF